MCSIWISVQDYNYTNVQGKSHLCGLKLQKRKKKHAINIWRASFQLQN